MTRIIGIVILLPLLYVLAVLVASEFGGEVVEVETFDDRGRKFSTSLWIVDLYGDTWIRAGDPDSAWVQRLRVNPEVAMTREGARATYHAEIVEDFAERINDGMREKYGRADQLISTIHDDEAVLAIRLVPR